MPDDLNTKIDQLTAAVAAQDKRLEAIYVSSEKTRKYFLWTLIITGVTIIVPLIGLAFAIPYLLSTYSSFGNL